MPGGSPWPDATPARAEIFPPTAVRPDGLVLVRSRGRRDPCPRDRSPPGRAPPSSHAGRSVSPVPPVAASPGAGGDAGRRERQSRAVAHGALPRGGVRDGVLPLWVLLAGAGLLWAICRATAQRHQRRRATAKHQRSLEGRLDHRDRQRVYRARCRLRVTDAPSPRRPRSTTITPPGRHAAHRPVCLVCGRVWVRRRARREPPARSGGAERRKAPDNGDS